MHSARMFTRVFCLLSRFSRWSPDPFAQIDNSVRVGSAKQTSDGSTCRIRRVVVHLKYKEGAWTATVSTIIA